MEGGMEGGKERYREGVLHLSVCEREGGRGARGGLTVKRDGTRGGSGSSPWRRGGRAARSRLGRHGVYATSGLQRSECTRACIHLLRLRPYSIVPINKAQLAAETTFRRCSACERCFVCEVFLSPPP